MPIPRPASSVTRPAVLKPGVKMTVGQFGVAVLLAFFHQTHRGALLADALQVQAAAVVAEFDTDFVTFLRERHDDGADGVLAHVGAHLRCLDAVRDAVAQQVLEGTGHAVEDAAVDFDRAADDVQPHLLAGFLGRLPNHTVEAIGQALELHHARAQQVVLQVAGEPRLGGQFVFGALQRALQGALHGGHVVHRLGHHARDFLEARETVELERIEGLAFGLGGLHARGHLRLGLQLDVTHLLAQALEVVAQVAERALDQADIGLDARAGDGHLAGLVDETVEQGRTHAHRRLRGGAAFRRAACRTCDSAGEPRPVDLGHRHRRKRRRRHVGRRSLGVCAGCLGLRDVGQRSHRRFDPRRLHDRGRLDHGRRGLGRCRLGGCPLGRSHRVGVGAGIARTQRVEGLGQRVGTCLQFVDVGFDGLGLREHALDLRFQPVRHFAQPHGTGQASTALERVQGTHAGGGVAALTRISGPGAHLRAQRGQQLLRFLLEDREQFGVDRIHRIEVVVDLLDDMVHGRSGACCRRPRVRQTA